jgi:hypothetical protein
VPAKPKIDVTSGPDASRDPSAPPNLPDDFDSYSGGPHSLDEVIFD